MTDDLAYWLAWHRIPQMGAVRLRRLHQTFGTMQAAWQADERALANALGMAPEVLGPCLQARSLWPPAEQVATLQAAGVSAVSLADDRYPARLRELHDAPPLLYFVGTCLDLSRGIAIVGTRRPTGYGREVAFRLGSELCAAVVVVEAGERSGALITADFAGEQGRDVFAVPGPITSPASAGTHQLIRDGATLIGGAQQILDELGWSRHGSDACLDGDSSDLTNDERHVYIQLNEQPQHFDTLLRRSGSQEGSLAAVLLSLELKGRARQLAGHHFVRGS